MPDQPKKKKKDNDEEDGLKMDRNALEQMFSTSANLKTEIEKISTNKKEKNCFYLSKSEFVSIEFDHGWPLIVKDIFKNMTGLPNLLKSTVIPEADEFHNNSSLIPPNGFFEENELN